MTPSAVSLEAVREAAGPTTELLVCLDELCELLMQLKHSDVEDKSAQLETVAQRLLTSGLTLTEDESLALRSQLKKAFSLSHNARRFYEGWSRIAALTGPAYTPMGQETVISGGRSVALEA